VINYHLPRQLENYLHRAGRTARAGRKGLVVNLVTERDEFLLAKLEGRSIKEIDSSKYNSHPRASAKKHAAKKGSGKGTALPKRTPKVENKLKAASPKTGAFNKKADKAPYKTAGAPSNKAHKAAHGGKKLGLQKPSQKSKGPSKRA